MKNQDQILMEQAYEQVMAIHEKVSMKGALAGAALGLGTMLGGHASDLSQQSQSSISQTSISPQKAYETIIELVHAKQTKLPKNLIQIVMQDKALAHRLAHSLTLQQVPLPSELKSIVGNYDSQLKNSLVGP
jgi:hypothetical protein